MNMTQHYLFHVPLDSRRPKGFGHKSLKSTHLHSGSELIQEDCTNGRNVNTGYYQINCLKTVTEQAGNFYIHIIKKYLCLFFFFKLSLPPPEKKKKSKPKALYCIMVIGV